MDGWMEKYLEGLMDGWMSVQSLKMLTGWGYGGGYDEGQGCAWKFSGALRGSWHLLWKSFGEVHALERGQSNRIICIALSTHSSRASNRMITVIY